MLFFSFTCVYLGGATFSFLLFRAIERGGKNLFERVGAMGRCWCWRPSSSSSASVALLPWPLSLVCDKRGETPHASDKAIPYYYRASVNVVGGWLDFFLSQIYTYVQEKGEGGWFFLKRKIFKKEAHWIIIKKNLFCQWFENDVGGGKTNVTEVN
jgi:hypothetical protein